MDAFSWKRITQKAVADLDEVVLDVLYKARSNVDGLQPVVISEMIGIPLPSQHTVGMAAPIVRGILGRLEYGGLVEQKVKYGPWEITAKGIEIQRVKEQANV